MMQGAMHNPAKALLDFLLPPVCPVTGQRVAEPGLLSAQAWEGLRFVEEPFCACCGDPQPFIVGQGEEGILCARCLADRPAFDSARAIWAYRDTARDLMLRFKHGDQLQLARSFMPALRRAVTTLPAHPSVVIPVPLHRWRLLKRLYNQAAVLAARLAAEEPSLTYLPDTLVRRRATKSQGHMDAVDRRKNVRNAFEVPALKRPLIQGKHVLLLDDVFTSGATAHECARTLKAAGASRVDVLTLTRVVRD